MKKQLRRVVFGAALSIAMVATAYFAGTYLSTGVSPERQTGTGEGNIAMPISIDFPSGLTPANPVPVTATVNNTTGRDITWRAFTTEIVTPTAPICGEEWLRIDVEKTEGGISSIWTDVQAGVHPYSLKPIPPGVHSIWNYGPLVPTISQATLRFDPTIAGTTDQALCENVPVKIVGHLTE
jgi:hypothetical protein